MNAILEGHIKKLKELYIYLVKLCETFINKCEQIHVGHDEFGEELKASTPDFAGKKTKTRVGGIKSIQKQFKLSLKFFDEVFKEKDGIYIIDYAALEVSSLIRAANDAMGTSKKYDDNTIMRAFQNETALLEEEKRGASYFKKQRDENRKKFQKELDKYYVYDVGAYIFGSLFVPSKPRDVMVKGSITQGPVKCWDIIKNSLDSYKIEQCKHMTFSSYPVYKIVDENGKPPPSIKDFDLWDGTKSYVRNKAGENIIDYLHKCYDLGKWLNLQEYQDYEKYEDTTIK